MESELKASNFFMLNTLCEDFGYYKILIQNKKNIRYSIDFCVDNIVFRQHGELEFD